MRICKEALEANDGNKDLHYVIGQLLPDIVKNGEEREYHFRRAFSSGDKNYEAQFWYARQLYLNGRFDESSEWFRLFRDKPIPPMLWQKIRGAYRT